jgi:hypothetical protein
MSLRIVISASPRSGRNDPFLLSTVFGKPKTLHQNVVCLNSLRVFYHKISRILAGKKQKRHSSDTILFVAATKSFSAFQDRANDLFHQTNEKLLAENDATSQAASAHAAKRYDSRNDLFPFLVIWIVTKKTGNTGTEKLSGRTYLILDGVYPLYKLIEGNSMKSYGAGKANRNSTNNTKPNLLYLAAPSMRVCLLSF